MLWPFYFSYSTRFIPRETREQGNTVRGKGKGKRGKGKGEREKGKGKRGKVLNTFTFLQPSPSIVELSDY
jgi:hypothetical protein